MESFDQSKIELEKTLTKLDQEYQNLKGDENYVFSYVEQHSTLKLALQIEKRLYRLNLSDSTSSVLEVFHLSSESSSFLERLERDTNLPKNTLIKNVPLFGHGLVKTIIAKVGSTPLGEKGLNDEMINVGLILRQNLNNGNINGDWILEKEPVSKSKRVEIPFGKKLRARD